jgi:hypothetical protein
MTDNTKNEEICIFLPNTTERNSMYRYNNVT